MYMYAFNASIFIPLGDSTCLSLLTESDHRLERLAEDMNEKVNMSAHAHKGPKRGCWVSIRSRDVDTSVQKDCLMWISDTSFVPKALGTDF